jgi:hypothetical protein
MRSLFLLISSVFTGFAYGQQVEIGLMLGASNYNGDLSNETFLMKESHFSGSFFGRYNINNRWAIKGMIGYGRVSGDDKNFTEVRNKLRNLNFYSDIYEFSVHGEFNLLKNDLNSISSRQFLPYLFGGIGVFNFNPKTTFGGKTYELQPLGTEGQGTTSFNELKKYDLTAVCIPMGLGFRQKIGDDFFIGVEGGIRFTRTNYLDDVGGYYASPEIVRAAYGDVAGYLSDRSWETVDLSATGSPVYLNKEGDNRSFKQKFKNDAYFLVGVTFSYVIRSKGQGCPQF